MSYHDMPGLSSSQIAEYIRDPIQWYHVHVLKDWPKQQATDEMAFGTAVHRMIEYGGWESLVREIPREVLNADGHCKGKAWTEWKSANKADVYLKPGEPNQLRVIWEHLQANSWCREIMDICSKEVEHIWDDEDFGPCRVLMDAVGPPLILVDWKTTVCRSPREFARDVWQRAYDVRMAFYRRGFVNKFGSYRPNVYLVAICNSGGMSVTPYQLSNEWLDDAEARLILAVDEMKRFHLANHLNRPPELLTQPRWSQTNLEAVA